MKRSRKLALTSVLVLVLNIICFSLVDASTYGDVNNDGGINSTDYALLNRYILGTSNINDVNAADLNGDGGANSTDYAILRRFLLGLIDKFPVEEINPPKATDKPNEEKKTSEEKLKGDIIFSVPSSTFTNQVSVSFNSKVSNAEIRYTTDGSAPNGNSRVYNGPLTFTATTQLRAQAFVNGVASGDMGTAIYVASSIDTKHDIPVLILDAYGKGKPERDYRDVAFMLMEPNNSQASLLQTPTVATRAGFHIRGQSSANFEKTPYRIELWDNEGEDAKYTLLGMAKDGDWAILSPFPDKSLIRNALAYELGKKVGLDSPDYRFVEVYINFDNQPVSATDYQGVYLLTEVLQVDKDRINLAKLKEDDLTEPNISGGYLMQFNMMVAEEPLIRGNGWSDLEVKEPDDLRPEQMAWITSYIQKVHNSIHSANPSDPQTGYPAYIDVDSFINFVIINEMARQGDSYMRSTYINKDRG